MSDYTPTTYEVRDSWRRGRLWITGSNSGSNAEFDRWLESIKADAWDEGHEAGDDDGYSTAMHEERGVGEDLSTPTPNPYRTEHTEEP